MKPTKKMVNVLVNTRYNNRDLARFVRDQLTCDGQTIEQVQVAKVDPILAGLSTKIRGKVDGVNDRLDLKTIKHTVHGDSSTRGFR